MDVYLDYTFLRMPVCCLLVCLAQDWMMVLALVGAGCESRSGSGTRYVGHGDIKIPPSRWKAESHFAVLRLVEESLVRLACYVGALLQLVSPQHPIT